MTRSLRSPSSNVNFRSFLLFFTASHARIFTARKSDFANVSKSTISVKIGSIFTLEKSICVSSQETAGAACAGASAGLPPVLPPPSEPFRRRSASSSGLQTYALCKSIFLDLSILSKHFCFSPILYLYANSHVLCFVWRINRRKMAYVEKCIFSFAHIDYFSSPARHYRFHRRPSSTL